MKRGKNPTRSQKILIKKWGLNPQNWLVQQYTKENLVILHRHTNRERKIDIRKESV